MSKFIDLTGRKYRGFLVLKRTGTRANGAVLWLCRCDCGKELILCSADFTSDSRQRSGCRDCFMKTFITHGMTGTKEHHAWNDMRSRCDLKKNTGYKDYGGRGIGYSDEWSDFAVFIKDMGLAPSPKHTLERINVNGNYQADNCKWATIKEQSRNKRNSRMVCIDGETKCLAEWCEIYRAKHNLVSRRLQAGWPIKEAMSIPSLGVYRGGSRKYFPNNK